VLLKNYIHLIVVRTITKIIIYHNDKKDVDFTIKYDSLITNYCDHLYWAHHFPYSISHTSISILNETLKDISYLEVRSASENLVNYILNTVETKFT
jgi:hypothetical protein